MKKLALLIITLISLNTLAVENLDSFYSEAHGKSGFELKTALKNIIKSSHKPKSYRALFQVYLISDLDTTYENDGSILDIYSENPRGNDRYNFSKEEDKCGNYRAESDCFNREHIFPQSIFKKAAPMRSDYFHVFPTDGAVNGMRSNFPFGEVREAKKISLNGSKLGRNVTSGYRGLVFEPIDEFKGDVARALLYFATRYQDRISRWHHDMLDGSRDRVYKKWFITLLLKWHKADPVSKHEMNRNNAGEIFQGNRNPFIDHPEYAELIWN